MPRRPDDRSPYVGDLIIFREEDIEVMGIVYRSDHTDNRVWIKWAHNNHNGYLEFLDREGYPSINIHNGYDRFEVIHGYA